MKKTIEQGAKFSAPEKLNDFLYSMEYIDYVPVTDARGYEVKSFSCSGVRNGNFHGRDLDRKYARLVQRMWVNFAKTGNPSLSAEESPTGKAITWEQYNSETKPVMVFDEFDVHLSTETEVKTIDWERVYPLTDYYLFLPA